MLEYKNYKELYPPNADSTLGDVVFRDSTLPDRYHGHSIPVLFTENCKRSVVTPLNDRFLSFFPSTGHTVVDYIYTGQTRARVRVLIPRYNVSDFTGIFNANDDVVSA